MKKRILSILLVIIFCVGLLPAVALATIVASGTCGANYDNVNWLLDNESLLLIRGTGAMKNYSARSAPWYAYNKQIYYVSIGEPSWSSQVTSIGDYAFYDCNMKRFYIYPNDITIGDLAFYSCDDLQIVGIFGSVKSVGHSAFGGCTSLTSIEFPDGLIHIGNLAFNGCKSLTSVRIPDSVTSIGSQAFLGCTALTDVIIPDSVTSIGDYAFSGCSSLRNVTFGNVINGFSWSIFNGCNNLRRVTLGSGIEGYVTGMLCYLDCLEDVEISSENSVYASSYGMVFSKDMTELFFCPRGKSGSITIPQYVTTIKPVAFSDCSHLSSITIPDSVTKIMSGAFFACNSITDVYYGGTEEQWSSIEIEDNNDPLLNATIHYTIPIDSIEIDQTVLAIGKGDIAPLTVTVIPEDATDKTVTWTSSDPEVAIVDNEGNVTAVAVGTATITAAAGDVSASCAVTVFPALVINTQPANQTVVAGNAAAFAVEADGFELTYQWQYSLDAGESWTDCSATGFDTPAYSFITNFAMDGRYYRCVVSSTSGSVTSDPAALKILSAPVITAQPQSVTTEEGENVEFTVVAIGSDLTYQWQYRVPGGTWNNATDSGCNTATLTLPASMSLNGNNYRCFVRNALGSDYSDPVALIVTVSIPRITSQPTGQSVLAGATATFKVTASGIGLTYRWEESADSGITWKNCTGQGYDTDTLTITATVPDNGKLYRCAVTNANGSAMSDAAMLTLQSPPVITTQPESVTAEEGKQDAVFSIVASGSDLLYRWQYRVPGGVWIDATETGCNTAALTVPATMSRNGYNYRCIVSNELGSDASDTVTLTVIVAVPEITTQPEDQEVIVGETVMFTVSATGAESYQWQYSKNGGSTWLNSPTGKLAAFNFTATSAMNGRMYRCIVTNANGSTTSSAATLTVISKPVITTQPTDLTVNAGDTATFTVTATGVESYQWQYSKDGGTWLNSAAASGTKATISVKAKATYNGYQYRCVVTNGAGDTTSNAAILTVRSKPKITTQPMAQTVNAGETVTFTVAATGAESYQWQYSKNGGTTWANNSATGSNTNTFSFKTTSAMSGRQYRCVVTNGAGDTTSNAATLIVLSKPKITTQPMAQTVNAGDTVTFMVTATGAESYQWQYSKDSGSTWSNCTGTAASFTFKAKASFNGYQYRCIVTNENGSTTSNAATLTVLSKPKITAQPTDQTVNAGETVTFTVTATGAERYQWQYSKNGGTTWANNSATGSNTDTFSFKTSAAMNGRMYRCVVTNADGDTTSNAATLTVISKPVITTQPTAQTVNAGETVTFTVVAPGADSYQWQYSKNGGSTWLNCSGKAAEFRFTATAALNGRLYRCVVTNPGGETVSNTVTLTVTA